MPRGVSPRTLLIAMIGLVVIVGIVVAWLILRPHEDPYAGIIFETFSADSTATAVFAGEFPPADMPGLGRPIDVVGDGEWLYVAEPDEAIVSVWSYDGVFESSFSVDPAAGASGFYPVDLTIMADGRLAIVDTAGMRVVIVDPLDLEESPIEIDDVGGEDWQPTAIDVVGDELLVADGADQTLRVLSARGRLRRTLAADLEPALTFVGALHAEDSDDVVYIADSNAGRVVMLDVNSDELLGIGASRFDLPRGIAVVLDSRVAVVDTFARTVVVLDDTVSETFDRIGTASTEGIGRGGELLAPESVHWDDQNSRLYVADPGSGRIKIYELRAGTDD